MGAGVVVLVSGGGGGGGGGGGEEAVAAAAVAVVTLLATGDSGELQSAVCKHKQAMSCCCREEQPAFGE